MKMDAFHQLKLAEVKKQKQEKLKEFDRIQHNEMIKENALKEIIKEENHKNAILFIF